ncbi:hypothetical protein HPP92_006302 [Vanilla planifolia]|uniref:Uncharacterized protein n=1 Tax=Vanilla planifolia TaxID=51239 RepID=A0A835RK29_VANPL|nr:hypothetical protein HPP92_006302 [Vanilla planifolia]
MVSPPHRCMFRHCHASASFSSLLAEAAAAVASDPHDLGHMVARVVQQLDIGQLPELDAIGLLERTVLNFPPFSNLDKDRLSEILGQGRFLLHCAMRWFLTTGRHPLPIVAAVLTFVAKVNGVNISIEDIAKEIHAGVATCRSRVRELLQVLVRVAKLLLPWGDDVTMKNIVHNAPVLIRFMELKSRYKSNHAEKGDGHLQDTRFNLGDILNTFSEYRDVSPEESKYFNLEDEVTGNQMLSFDKLKRLKLSATEICLSHSYQSVLDRLPGFNNKSDIGTKTGNKRRRKGLEIEDWIESWQGRWESDKGLTVDQILERCEGFDALPPSFINGIDMQRRRKVKIEAAKNRILKTMKRTPTIGVMAPIGDGDEKLSKHLTYRKRRRNNRAIDGIDWEDCIIELLLLHQVDDEEIQQGQYNRLLDLHVFYSSDLEELSEMAKSKLFTVDGSHSAPS